MMKHTGFRFAAALPLVALFAIAPSARAQDTNARVMDMIYAKLRVICGDNPKTSGTPSTSTLVLLRPGIAMDFNETDAKNEKYVKERISITANRLPNASYFYETSLTSLEDVWESILKYHQTAPTTITPAEQQKMEEAEAFLAKKVSVEIEDPDDETATKTKTFKSRQSCYDYFQKLSDAADKAYEIDKDAANLLKKAPTRALLREKEIANRAFADTKLGNRDRVQVAIQTVAECVGRDPKTFWFKADTEFKQMEFDGLNGKKFHEISTDPTYDIWSNKEGWTKITMDSSTSDYSSASKSFSASVGGGGGWGLFSISGSGSTSESQQSMQMANTKCNITCEVKRVQIFRPWLNGIVFGAPWWNFNSDPMAAPFLNLSTGLGITDGVPRKSATGATELMPLVPTEFLLARNVRITADIGMANAQAMQKSVTAGGSAGWGPFAVSTSVTTSSSSASGKSDIGANGISFTGVQIIGVICSVQPKIPNPDPKLFPKK
ncbi:hypothetical protein [Armatimonas sp.]|uniref:hypothetical protein n=1 Tax=Armatimonas sp. TaxID=1872638 RepID=UPI0037514E1B